MENWKDIKGYEGLYQVSDLGRVKRIGQKVMTTKGFFKQIRERILRQTNLKGYLKVSLCKDGKAKTHSVHSLVAGSFLNHTTSIYIVIDHINNNRKDNRLENLQIITQRLNSSKDRDGISKYTGVTWHKKDKRWQSSIIVNRKTVYLGYFKSEERAAIAYQFALTQIDKIKNLMTN